MIKVSQILEGKGNLTWTIEPGSTVFDALQIMAEKSIGALVVVRSGVVGIVTERDYARKVILAGRFSKETRVDEIMSVPVYGAHLDTTAEECMGLMTNLRIRHLPVFEAGKLVGIVSIGDIVKAIIDEQQILIGHLEDYIMGKYPA